MQGHPTIDQRWSDHGRGHCIKHWSTTQTTVSLSSAEAELHGIAKGASQGLGMRSIGRDLGIDFTISVFTDASAALGMVRRRGLGRVRHLDVTDLWVQEQVRNKEIDVPKVAGAENMADLLTKNLDRPLMTKHLSNMNIFPEQGRATAAPQLT